jgi:stringent starvation protein B
MDIEKMTPRRPYMLRAFYEWLVDNELTPHLVVDATMPGVRVPMEFVQDGQIILNLVPRAVGNLEMGNEAVTFNARFGGRPHSVIVPLYAVQAIYARENGAGTMFEPEDAYMDEYNDAPDIVEVDDDETNAFLSEPDEDLQLGETSEDEAPRPKKGKPTLRVVK